MINIHGFPAFKKHAEKQLHISLCMPIYKPNWEMFVAAIKSVEEQGYGPYVLYIADRDVSLANIVPEDWFLDRANRELGNRKELKCAFEYIPSQDTNVIAGLNRALRDALGDVLYFMCADDLLCPGTLTLVNDLFQGRVAEPFWIYGRTETIDVEGKRLGVSGGPFTYEDMLIHNRIGTNSVFWNHKMMEVVGMFDEKYRYAADYDMWMRMWNVRPPVFVDYIFGSFRRHAAQTSEVSNQAVVNEAFLVSDKYIAAYRKNGFLAHPEWEI